MTESNTIENVVIIGGGPAGLAAAVYNARANLNPLVFAGSPPGGQLTLTTEVENYPGYESILGPELIEKMRNHAKKFGTRVIDENVLKVDFSTRPFKIYLRDGYRAEVNEAGMDKMSEGNGTQSQMTNTNTGFSNNKSSNLILAQSVIIATGAKALWLGLESETRLRGKGVSACATCDGFFFKNKVVAVVGGGDTALEEALTLTRFASKVYVIHRRDSFRASRIMQDRVLAHDKIEVIWNSTVEEVLGENRLEGVRLKSTVNEAGIDTVSKGKGTKSSMTNTDTGFSNILPIDGLFIAIGHKPDTELFKDQVMVDEKGYVLTSAAYALANSKLKTQNLKQENTNFNFDYQTMTSVSGVFAAGDNVDHTYRQAATAVGMGVAAALDVERYLTEQEESKK